MPLNVSKGNMYEFVSHTWNTVKGMCEHDCQYCYMKVFKLGPRRFDTSELKTDLGAGNFIFVGSSNDMFSKTVPREWIIDTLYHCRKHYENQYLFQSKNPNRFWEFRQELPVHSFLCTTIETNRPYKVSGAPSPYERALAMNLLTGEGFQTVVTIEPILDFDLEKIVQWMNVIHPQWISIGADSKGHNLPEPPARKVNELITILSKNFKVIQKPNLRRLLNGGLHWTSLGGGVGWRTLE